MSYISIIGLGVTAALGLVCCTAASRSYSARVLGLGSVLISATVLMSSVCRLASGPMVVRHLPATGNSTRNAVIRAYSPTVLVSLILGAAAALPSPLWSSSRSLLAHGTGWLIGFTVTTACWTLHAPSGVSARRLVPTEAKSYGGPF